MESGWYGRRGACKSHPSISSQALTSSTLACLKSIATVPRGKLVSLIITIVGGWTPQTWVFRIYNTHMITSLYKKKRQSKKKKQKANKHCDQYEHGQQVKVYWNVDNIKINEWRETWDIWWKGPGRHMVQVVVGASCQNIGSEIGCGEMLSAFWRELVLLNASLVYFCNVFASWKDWSSLTTFSKI